VANYSRPKHECKSRRRFRLIFYAAAQFIAFESNMN
jgi:hypothetical protein